MMRCVRGVDRVRFHSRRRRRDGDLRRRSQFQCLTVTQFMFRCETTLNLQLLRETMVMELGEDVVARRRAVQFSYRNTVHNSTLKIRARKQTSPCVSNKFSNKIIRM